LEAELREASMKVSKAQEDVTLQEEKFQSYNADVETAQESINSQLEEEAHLENRKKEAQSAVDVKKREIAAVIVSLTNAKVLC
jgi:hypothetical protein